MTLKPLKLRCNTTDCPNDLHWFRKKPRQKGDAAFGPCADCGIDRIDWEQPHARKYYYDYTGAGIVAYVVDTGINVYPSEFGSRIVRQRNFSTNGAPGQLPNPNDVGDCYNHGTQIASIIGGTRSGVAKQVSLINVKVSPCLAEYQKITEWLAGLSWMTNDHLSHPGQMSVANMSLDAGIAYKPIDQAIIDATQAGITIVVAAGNAHDPNPPVDACTKSPMRAGSLFGLTQPDYDGNIASNPQGHTAITVAASESDDYQAYFSNFGPCVDLFAPGYAIEALANNGQYGGYSGTSVAAPYVTGVAALFYERDNTATPGVLQSRIKDNATPNVIRGISANTPNLLLYSYYRRLRPTR